MEAKSERVREKFRTKEDKVQPRLRLLLEATTWHRKQRLVELQKFKPRRFFFNFEIYRSYRCACWEDDFPRAERNKEILFRSRLRRKQAKWDTKKSEKIYDAFVLLSESIRKISVSTSSSLHPMCSGLVFFFSVFLCVNWTHRLLYEHHFGGKTNLSSLSIINQSMTRLFFHLGLGFGAVKVFQTKSFSRFEGRTGITTTVTAYIASPAF